MKKYRFIFSYQSKEKATIEVIAKDELGAWEIVTRYYSLYKDLHSITIVRIGEDG